MRFLGGADVEANGGDADHRVSLAELLSFVSRRCAGGPGGNAGSATPSLRPE